MHTTTRPGLFAPPSALGKLTIGALLGTASAATLMLARMYAVAGEIAPPVIAFVLVPALASAALLLRRRWAPLPGAIAALLIVLMLAPHLPHILSVPADVMFTPFVLLVAFSLAAAVLGSSGALLAWRRREARVPRWLPVPLGALLGVAGGVLLMGALPQHGATSTVPEDALARLPVVATEQFEFVQQEIRVRAGSTVALRLENRDGASHSFDVDEFEVHVLMPPAAATLAVFTPTEPGTYTFYCAPHYDRRTGKGMKGTLIVEP